MSEQDQEPGAEQGTGFFNRGMTRRMLLKAGAVGVAGTAGGALLSEDVSVGVGSSPPPAVLLSTGAQPRARKRTGAIPRASS